MNILKKIYDKNIVIAIYILLPIIEVITTVMKTYTNCVVTLGMIYKTLFIIYCIIYILFITKQNKKINYALIGIYLAYMLISYFVTTPTLSLSCIINKLVIFSRFICLPIILLFLYNYLNENYINIKLIGICATIYGLIMILSLVTNTQYASYSTGFSKGMSGWFNSGNEISSLFCMFLPVMIYLMIKYKKIIYILGFIFTGISLCLIGTKTALVGLVVSSVIFLVYSIICYLNKNSKAIYEKMVIVSTIYIVLVSLVIPITPAYKSLVEKFGINNEHNNQESTVVLSSFIYNGREEDLKEQLEIYMDSPIKEKLFGISDDRKLLTNSGEFNVIERDYYDIIFIHGLIGCALFFAPIIMILLDKLKSIKLNLKSVMLFSSIILGLVISYVAGHVLLAPTVAIFFSFIFVSVCLDEKEKEKLIIYMPKLSVGGMERALINYLNMCNTLKKYEVTLVLGYVTDKKLLNELPSNISVRLLCTGKWNVLGKIQSGLNYIIELIYIMIYNYDISICYSYHHKVLSVISRIASKNNILFMHTDLIHSRTQEEINKLNKKVKFEKFKTIVCVSDAAKNSIKKLYPNYRGNLVTIYNYINGGNILKLSNEKINENIIIKNKSKISFINVSRHFERAKKISRIIESAYKLKKEGYDFIVYLVGDGQNSNDYLSQINKLKLNDVVYLLGRQNNPYKYIKNSNYLVISSDFEGYGIVIDEAKVLNIPIITTNIADAKKMVQDYGVVVENSENGVYEGMKKALNGEVKINNTFNYLEFNKILDADFDKLFSYMLDNREDEYGKK